MQSFYVSQIHIRYIFLLQTSERMDFFFMDNCSLPVNALVSFLCFIVH